MACDDHLSPTPYAHGTRISHCVAKGDLRRFTCKCIATNKCANGIQYFLVSRCARDVVAIRPPSLASTVPLFRCAAIISLHGTTRVTPTTVRLEDWMQCNAPSTDEGVEILCKNSDRLVAHRMIIFLLRPSCARFASQMAGSPLRLRCTRSSFVMDLCIAIAVAIAMIRLECASRVTICSACGKQRRAHTHDTHN